MQGVSESFQNPIAQPQNPELCKLAQHFEPASPVLLNPKIQNIKIIRIIQIVLIIVINYYLVIKKNKSPFSSQIFPDWVRLLEVQRGRGAALKRGWLDPKVKRSLRGVSERGSLRCRPGRLLVRGSGTPAFEVGGLLKITWGSSTDFRVVTGFGVLACL